MTIVKDYLKAVSYSMGLHGEISSEVRTEAQRKLRREAELHWYNKGKGEKTSD